MGGERGANPDRKSHFREKLEDLRIKDEVRQFDEPWDQ